MIGFAGVSLLLASCGSDDTSPIPAGATTEGGATNTATTAPSAAPTATPELPAAGIEVVFMVVDPTSRVLRFYAAINNPSSRTIEGLKLRWDATDASGALIGGFSTAVPPVAGKSVFAYVGGAGGANLTGVAAKVAVKVEDPGHLTDKKVTPWTVEPGPVAKEDIFDDQYQASFTITTGPDAVATSKIVVSVLFKDATGAVVCAEFERPSGLPASLPPGTKFKVESRFAKCTGKPVTAEAYAVDWP